jgi:hypothetical protein
MPKNERVYSIADATLQQHGTTVARTLSNDMVQFQLFDSTIKMKFLKHLACRKAMACVR